MVVLSNENNESFRGVVVISEAQLVFILRKELYALWHGLVLWAAPDISPSLHHLFDLRSLGFPPGIQIDKY